MSMTAKPRLMSILMVWMRVPMLVRISVLFVLLMMLTAIFATVFAPYDYAKQNLFLRLEPPFFLGGSMTHPLGTDGLGRDILSRLMMAIRVSIAVALVGTLIGAVLGTIIGFVAAHFRGLVEEVIMALVDAQAALPFLIIVLAVLAFFGNNLWLFIGLMGIYGWETYARLIRGMVLSANTQGYAMAARSLGFSPLRIYRRHVLPNIFNVLIVQFSLNFPQTILLETSLSFLGLGIQAPLTSLGEMLGSGRDHLVLAWWVAVIPGIVIFLTTLSISLIGDWLRDRLDPTLTNTAQIS